MRGGKFETGLISGAVGSASGSATDGMITGDMDKPIRAVITISMGGVASQASGGSFQDGAISAATVFLFNDMAGRNDPKKMARGNASRAAHHNSSLEERAGGLYPDSLSINIHACAGGCVGTNINQDVDLNNVNTMFGIGVKLSPSLDYNFKQIGNTPNVGTFTNFNHLSVNVPIIGVTITNYQWNQNSLWTIDIHVQGPSFGINGGTGVKKW